MTSPAEQAVLSLRFHIKSGMKGEFESLLKDMLDTCAEEESFVSVLWHESPERFDEIELFEVWKGTQEQFLREQGPKPYRQRFIEQSSRFVDHVDVEWSVPVYSW